MENTTRPGRDTTGIAFLAASSLGALALALLVPDLTKGSGMDGMPMTHYMGLLSVRQPWNLLLFMALPVILAPGSTTGLSHPRWVCGLARSRQGPSRELH